MKMIWSDFKSICESKLLAIQMTECEVAYRLFALDSNFKYETSFFKDSEDGADFIANYLSEVNKPIDQKTSDAKQKVSAYEPEGDSATIVSHDFTDPCSWYQGSLAATDAALTFIANSTYSFQAPNVNWIDLQNGRLYGEDNILAQNPTYAPVVKVAGVTQTSGFTIDYKLGRVTFASMPSGDVTTSYRYADKSWFIIKPKAGKILSIKSAEVQFSSNVVIDNPFYFEAWVNHPQYGMIAIPGTRITYKSAKDFISACNEGQGLIPKWSNLQNDVHVFPFHYARPKPLKSSEAVEIRVYCKNHTPIVGEFATATFYVNVDTE